MIKESKKVQVLISTYNGEKYLEALIESVLNQDIQSLELLIRDDGSSDNTLKILNKYSMNHSNIKILLGKNVGVVKSFFKLLAMSSPNSDYYAFCDQDDIWMKDKLSRAIECIDEVPKKTPTMYCSGTVLVDDKLRIIKYSEIPRKLPCFENALVQNIATGCTVVINKSARNLIFNKTPSFALMHDWWVYLVVSAFGKVIYDVEPKILYRQHCSNTIGVETNFIRKWNGRIMRFIKRGKKLPISQQVNEFQRVYGMILPEDKGKILNKFINSRKTLISRIYYAFNGEVFRQSLIDDIILRILIIFNRI